MSLQKRKLGYWSLEFAHGDNEFFDRNLFVGFMTYLSGLDTQSSLQRDSKNNKAIAVDRIWETDIQGATTYEIRFKSCKYNHSPDYMSSTDGSERPTEKQLYEGDKEVTHICMRIDALEVMCVVEERRSGVTFGAVIRYLNEKLRNYLCQENQDEGVILIGSIVPPQDFLAALEATDRITIAELFVDKEVMGTDYLGFLEIDASTREEVVMTVKSKPKQSIAKRAAREAFLGLTTEGTRVRRIRLRGRDYNNMSVIIDSLNAKKKDEVYVELMPNGIVNTASIFQKMEETLEV